MTWRQAARQIVERVVSVTLASAGREDPERLRRELRRALREAYPGSERRGWVYRVWLEECRRALWELGLEAPPLDGPLDRLMAGEGVSDA